MCKSRRAGILAVAGLVALIGGLAGSAAQADDQRWELGLRGNLATAGGEPTNDQMGGGIFGRYRLNEKWLVAVSIDQMSGDFETPYKLFGNTSLEEIDSTVDSTIITAWIEREYGKRDRKLRWFWGVGIGFTSPDVDDVTGSLTGGGTFDITTDAGSETLLSVAGGLRHNFSKRVGFEIGLRANQHFADWKLTDDDNGTTAELDDYTSYVLNVGLRVRL